MLYMLAVNIKCKTVNWSVCHLRLREQEVENARAFTDAIAVAMETLCFQVKQQSSAKHNCCILIVIFFYIFLHDLKV